MKIIPEALVYLVWVIAWTRLSPDPALFSSLDRHRKLILLSFFFLWGLAQTTQVSFYPFVPWGMFSKFDQSKTTEFYEIIGRTRADRDVQLAPADVTPSIRDTAIFTKMRQLFIATQARDISPEMSEACKRRYSDFLVSIGRPYNRRHSEDPLRAIEVFRCRFDCQAHPQSPVLSRESVWRVGVT